MIYTGTLGIAVFIHRLYGDALPEGRVGPDNYSDEHNSMDKVPHTKYSPTSVKKKADRYETYIFRRDAHALNMQNTHIVCDIH
jgi:hypothetical protein